MVLLNLCYDGSLSFSTFISNIISIWQNRSHSHNSLVSLNDIILMQISFIKQAWCTLYRRQCRSLAKWLNLHLLQFQFVFNWFINVFLLQSAQYRIWWNMLYFEFKLWFSICKRALNREIKLFSFINRLHNLLFGNISFQNLNWFNFRSWRAKSILRWVFEIL